jgi:hypothetical protein
MKKLERPPHGLSLQFVTADATNVDWRALGERAADGVGYETIFPVPTYGDVAEYDADIFEANESDDSDQDRRHHLPLSSNDLELWNQTDAHFEWRGRFDPMMNYAWPVEFAYEWPHDAEAVAALLREFAPNCVLVEFSDGCNPFGDDMASDTPEYGIALIGGGMDLSDDLAAAYLCCGCVPPEHILHGLSGVMSAWDRDRLPIVEAYDRAADWFAARAESLRDEAKRLAKKA